jgi:DNA polymerase III epsilon subunit-like protein
MKVACFDLETSNLTADFGLILCGSIKQFDQGKMETYRIDAFNTKKVNSNDSALVGALIRRLSDFDILVAHNGVKFDRPFLNSRALRWGFSSTDLLRPNGMIIDPVKLARNHLRLGYNGLDQVARLLGCQNEKTRIMGDTWMRAAMDRDPVAMDEVAPGHAR